MLQKERNPLDHRPLAPIPCTINHPAAMKIEFEKHPKSESLRRDYEDSLLKRLENIVSDVDRMIAITKPKCKPKEAYMRPIGDPRVAAQREILKEEKDKLTSEAVRLGEAGDVSGSQRVTDKIKECIRQTELIESKHTVDFPGEECCPVCCFRYLKGERPANVNTEISAYVWETEHKNDPNSKSHKAYVEIREWLEKLRSKKKERQLEEKKPKSRSRSRRGRSNDREKSPGDEQKQTKGGDADTKDRDKSRGRSRGEKGDRNKSNEDRRNRSRSRDDRKNRSRSRSRRGSDRRGRDRSDDRRRDRSNDRRRRDDDRGRYSDRGRSNDRRRRDDDRRR